MENVNKRFLEFYNYLIVHNSVKSAKDFAEIIGVSSSLITELTKGRTNIGTKTIQNTVIHFNLNANWLLTGEGEMTRKVITESIAVSPMVEYKKIDKYILQLENENKRLIADNERKQEIINSFMNGKIIITKK